MTDLDAFRAALHASPGTDDTALDLGRIMAEGGRLRRRRRLAGAGTGVATALVLMVGAVQVSRSFAPPAPRPGAQVAAPRTAAGPGDPAGATRPGVPEPAGPDRTPLGAVIPTGLTGTGGDLVFYLVRVENPQLVGTDFGVMAGVRDEAGELTGRIMSNESVGSGRSPGFHAVQGGMNVAGDDMPLFGYYVGPAKKIVSGGVVAKQRAWSEDSSIIVFWFDPAQTPRGFKGKGLVAYDKFGTKLPTGRRGVGGG